MEIIIKIHSVECDNTSGTSAVTPCSQLWSRLLLASPEVKTDPRKPGTPKKPPTIDSPPSVHNGMVMVLGLSWRYCSAPAASFILEGSLNGPLKVPKVRRNI